MNRGIWIWENKEKRNDEFAEFLEYLSLDHANAAVSVRISADSDYALYVNGALAGFGQYADFPHCKVANTHDISSFCHPGNNTILMIVWYHGVPSCTYYPGQPGLFYEISVDSRQAAVSGTHTLCRISPHYLSYRQKLITMQLGLSVSYCAAAEETAYHPAVATGYDPQLLDRPILALALDSLQTGSVIKSEGNTYFLLDLGKEEVGFLALSLACDREQTIVISYSEYLADGDVPRFIGPRDFSFEYRTQIGENVWLNPFRRLGCRYLAIKASSPIQLRYLGIRPTVYPVRKRSFDAGSARRQQIYDTAVRTLHLCMHEHYEDCPWREQALYTMDSRNQMLCSYYAFGETRYARANLWLIGQDRRNDGFLSMCVPSGVDLVIPSFCLHWYLEVWEYTEFSGDLSLARELWDKLCSVLDTFYSYRDRNTDLLPGLPDAQCWNFYEWTDTFSRGVTSRPGTPDLILNCLYLQAVEIMTKLSAKIGLPFRLSGCADRIRSSIRTAFRQENGLYQTLADTNHYSELGNALAVLTGVADSKDSRIICKVLANEETEFHVKKGLLDRDVLDHACDTPAADTDIIHMIPISLSMSAFVYDAMLLTDREHYRDYILEDIDRRYGMMLDKGATTFWETMDGWHAFENAGSLCHGWSSIPIYYYHALL